MSINISGNTISSSGFTTNGEILDPNIVTDGLALWFDPGNFYSSQGMSSYYNCGYGCQYYASDPGCTHCDTAILDMSGNGYDGYAKTMSVLYNSTNGGGSLYFPLNNNYTISGMTGWGSSFISVSGITVDAWYMPSGFTSLGGYIISNVGRFFPSGFYISVVLPPQITFGVVGNPSGGLVITSSTVPVKDTWYNIVGTMSCTGGTHMVLKLYINGELERSGSNVSTTPDLGTSSALLIGNEEIDGSGVRPLPGNLGPIRLYNRPLSHDEVRQNFNDTRRRYGI